MSQLYYRKDRTMAAINIRRNLTCVLVAAAACLATTASSASALNPQPLPPGHAIGIVTPPDPCHGAG